MDEMAEEEARAFLHEARFGVLALADGGKAYAVPLFYAYDGEALYFHSRRGAKDPFIRATEEGCFAVTNVGSEDEWTSVEVFGPVAKVVSDPERLAAMQALMAVPLPPEWGVTPTGGPRRSGSRSYVWKLTPKRISGRRSRARLAQASGAARRGVEVA